MSERVESKTRRNAPIAIDAEGFRRMGYRLVNDVALPVQWPSTLLRLYHLLACIDDVRALPEIVVRTGRHIDAELCSGGLL